MARITYLRSYLRLEPQIGDWLRSYHWTLPDIDSQDNYLF